MEPSDGFNGGVADNNQQLPPQPRFGAHSIQHQAAEGGGGAEEIDFDFKILASFLTEEGQYGGGEFESGSCGNMGRAALIHL